MSAVDPCFLYIDDDPLSREVVKVLLETVMGFTCTTYFETSHSFIERVEALSGPPNVIFLGIQVKPHNGYEMLAAFRNNPAYQKIIIIAVTAFVMVEDVERMKEAGFSGLISKPIIHRIFPELLNRILAGEAIWYIS